MRRRGRDRIESRPSLRERLVQTAADMDQARLQDRFAGLGLVSIADAAERRPVRVGGEIRLHESGPVGAPALRVAIADGTGTAVAMFSGRRRIGGLDVGRAVVIEGVARRERGQLVVRNPAYTLLP